MKLWFIIFAIIFNISCATHVPPPKPNDVSVTVFAAKQNTPVYKTSRAQTPVMTLPPMDELWTCSTCMTQKKIGRIQVYRYNPKELDKFEQYQLLGWIDRKDLFVDKNAAYNTPVFTSIEGAPVYKKFEGNDVEDYAPFMETFWTCGGCVTGAYEGRIRVYLYDGNEIDKSKQFGYVGWMNKQNLLLQRIPLKNEDKNDMTIVLSNDPTHHQEGKKLDKVPVRFTPSDNAKVQSELDIFEFYMVYAQTSNYLLIGKHRGITQPLGVRNVILGWVPKERTTYWQTRQAVQFIENDRDLRQPAKIYMTLEGLQEENEWDIVGIEDKDVSVGYNSLRFLVIDKGNQNEYYEVYYLSGGSVKDTFLFEEWLRLQIRDALEFEGVTDPEELDKRVQERWKPALENRYQIFRRGFIAAKQGEVSQLEEMVLVEKKHIVTMISNYGKILAAFDSAPDNRVKNCESTIRDILRETLPDITEEELRELIGEDGLDVESMNREMTGINFHGRNALLVLPCDQWTLLDPIEMESDANRMRLSQDRLVKILNNQESLWTGELAPHPKIPNRQIFQVREDYIEMEDPITEEYVEVDYRPKQFWWKRENVSYGWIPFAVFP